MNGSSVNGIKLFGSGRAVTFNNTVSAAGKWFGITTGGTGNTVNIGGAFTSSDFYVMNDGTLQTFQPRGRHRHAAHRALAGGHRGEG